MATAFYNTHNSTIDMRVYLQALFHMNRLHEALTHLTTALLVLGKKQPKSDFGCYVKILKEALRHYLHVFLPGYYIGGAGYVDLFPNKQSE